MDEWDLERKAKRNVMRTKARENALEQPDAWIPVRQRTEILTINPLRS